MRNIRLLIEYDGTNYVGWQRQANGSSIQGKIEEALRQILQEEVNVIGAGRTDAGVHARGQVAHCLMNSSRPAAELRRGLNALLPHDIVIHAAEEAPPDFHARYSAKARRYSYLIVRQPTAIRRFYSWHLDYPLDVDLMGRMAQMIVGEHDFQSYCRSGSDVGHHRCTVFHASWTEEDASLTFVIRADRYLRGMVRALVGTMVDVGRGYTSREEFAGILEHKSRSHAGMSAPARGLVLEEVEY